MLNRLTVSVGKVVGMIGNIGLVALFSASVITFILLYLERQRQLFPEYLGKWMKDNELSQAQAAEWLGVNKKSIHRWLTGKSKPPFGSVMQMQIRMHQLPHGTPYVYASQRLEDNTVSHAALFERESVNLDDLNFYDKVFIAHAEAKRQKRAKQASKRNRPRRSR